MKKAKIKLSFNSKKIANDELKFHEVLKCYRKKELYYCYSR